MTGDVGKVQVADPKKSQEPQAGQLGPMAAKLDSDLHSLMKSGYHAELRKILAARQDDPDPEVRGVVGRWETRFRSDPVVLGVLVAAGLLFLYLAWYYLRV